jgi:hypothetical protein
LRNSDHAFDSSHNATDYTAHHGTNHSADRTGRALTYGGAMLASTNNALGLGHRRHGKSGSNDDGHGELHLHEQTPPIEICGFDDRRVDLIRHYGATARRMRPLSIKIAAALAAMPSDHGSLNALSAGTLAMIPASLPMSPRNQFVKAADFHPHHHRIDRLILEKPAVHAVERRRERSFRLPACKWQPSWPCRR